VAVLVVHAAAEVDAEAARLVDLALLHVEQVFQQPSPLRPVEQLPQVAALADVQVGVQVGVADLVVDLEATLNSTPSSPKS
jgi:hypothetical protein